jgi:hypothetical protein
MEQDLFRSGQGTTFSEYAALGLTGQNQNVFGLEDTGDRVIWNLVNLSGNVRTYIQNVALNLNYESFISALNFNKVALTFDAQEGKTYINDVLLATDDDISIPETNILTIGTTNAGALSFFGHIKRIEVYDLALTANEVKAL